MNKKQFISIVIPAKDEAQNMKSLLKRIFKIINRFRSAKFEVIVVADNCTDKTAIISKKLGAKVLIRFTNPGKSKALIDGFKASKGEIIVMMDADLSHLPEELPQMIKKLLSQKDIGLVIASRFSGKSDDTTFIREIGGRLFNLLSNVLFHTHLTDAINGYKIFKRKVFDDYKYQADGYAIEIELIANTLRLGMKVAEIPSYEARRAGGTVKSKVIRDGWLFLKEIITEGTLYNLQKFRKQ